jgi:hypothetical protein
MRSIIVLALVALVVISAAPLAEEKSELKADLLRKFNSRTAKGLLERYGGKYDREMMKKMMQRGGGKLSERMNAALAAESMSESEVATDFEDKYSRMKAKSMLNKSDIKAKFMSLKKQYEGDAKVKTLDDVKSSRLAKSFKVPESIQLPEKFQKKFSHL